VNLAARLEQMADAGGVLISGKICDEIEGKIGRAFESRGEQQVKNLIRPVRVYALSSETPLRAEPRPLPLPDKPSIAVLPFTNMSGDPEQEYFADGVVEDIITALSRVKWFFVIARNSSFTYKGRAIDVRQVGRELGVRYLLEGSIRRAGNKVRITGQLIEAETGNHLWAARFDGLLEDVFDLQDRITRSVVGAIEPNLRLAEITRLKAKPTTDLGAYDLFLKALSELSTYTEERLLRAEELLRAALARDPDYADAWAILATTIYFRRVSGFFPLEEGARLACEAAYRAVAADPQNASALSSAASVLAYLGVNIDEAVEFADQAMSLSPHSAPVLTFCAVAYNFNGDFEKALSLAREAQRLSPRDPRGFIVLSQITTAYFFSLRFTEAVEWARRNLEQHPDFSPAWRFLASALAHQGRFAEAQEAVLALRKVQPNSTVSRSATTPYRHRWMVELYVDGLRKAGLPE
jgi:adenylate cyclase